MSCSSKEQSPVNTVGDVARSILRFANIFDAFFNVEPSIVTLEIDFVVSLGDFW